MLYVDRFTELLSSSEPHREVLSLPEFTSEGMEHIVVREPAPSHTARRGRARESTQLVWLLSPHLSRLAVLPLRVVAAVGILGGLAGGEGTTQTRSSEGPRESSGFLDEDLGIDLRAFKDVETSPCGECSLAAVEGK